MKALLRNRGLDAPKLDGWSEIETIVPGARAYQRTLDDGHLSVIVGHEPSGWHLSISHRLNILDPFTQRPLAGRIPTWDEIRDARYLFCPDVPYMAMILPPKDEYVNVHPTTMHLYEIPAEVAR